MAPIIITPKVAQQAAAHLTKHDPLLAAVIARIGLCTITPHRNYYESLVGSIISQQLSVKAADTIEKRFVSLFSDTFPAPEQIISKDIEELRQVGLSYQKARYIRDLAEHVISGQVRFDHLDSLTNDEIIAELTAVKGIGVWTVHMFLMFCMGRTDILATGDLGIKNGIKKLYDLPVLPSPLEVEELAKEKNWYPYQTFACWYIWQSLDNKSAI